MIEKTVETVVSQVDLRTVQDFIDLLLWVKDRDGLGCSVTATCDNDMYAFLDGVEISPVTARVGDSVTWDGSRFFVNRD